jgi:phosphohistidine phosphatase
MLRRLWIMRHGLAEDSFESDFTRPLSKTGELQAANVAEQLIKDSNQLPRDMLVSPFSRTQSTAKIVHKILGLSHPFETNEMLVHFADHQILGDFLLAGPYRDLIIVSHMPIVARLCQYLAPGCEIYGLETAQLVRMDFDESNNAAARVAKVYLPSL